MHVFQKKVRRTNESRAFLLASGMNRKVYSFAYEANKISRRFSIYYRKVVVLIDFEFQIEIWH